MEPPYMVGAEAVHTAVLARLHPLTFGPNDLSLRGRCCCLTFRLVLFDFLVRARGDSSQNLATHRAGALVVVVGGKGANTLKPVH
ncbi:hypothetical protein M3J09_007819 [Ascochyta lentis]